MKATLGGYEVYYEDLGNPAALPVVFIHGFPFSHEMWRPQLTILGARFRAVAYDLRGHGKSGAGDGQYTFEFFVDDLVALLDHMKIEKAVLCGLSMGGYIALRTVERNPERIRGLILADTQAKADSDETKLRRGASIKAVKAHGVNAYAEGFVKTAFAPESFKKKADAIDMIRRIIESNSAPGVCGALLALATRTDTTDALAGIRVPTLILVGEHDALTPVSASKEMHERIDNSEMHVIQNAAHMSNLENPEAFNNHVIDFLARLM
jgi:3-oxoadipate enol-lactonase